MYADDVVLYTEHKNLENLQTCLYKIDVWSKNHYLQLNKSKTQLLCLYPKNAIMSVPSSINILDEKIKVQSTAKYLGIWLDSNLTMSKQINTVCSQGYWMLRNLWRISSKVSDSERLS